MYHILIICAYQNSEPTNTLSRLQEQKQCRVKGLRSKGTRVHTCSRWGRRRTRRRRAGGRPFCTAPPLGSSPQPPAHHHGTPNQHGTLSRTLDRSGIWEDGSLTVSGERAAGADSSPAARAATTSLFGTPLRPSPPPPPSTAIGGEGEEGEEASASASAAGGSGLRMWASGSQAAQ